MWLERPPTKEKVERIKTALAEGRRSIEYLCELIYAKPITLHKICKKHNITLPDDMEPYPHNSAIDELLQQGFPRRLIASKLNKRQQAVDHYILVSGQRKIHDEAIRKYDPVLRKRAVEDILDTLQGTILKKVASATPIELQAIDATLKYHTFRSPASKGNYFTLFKNFFTALEKREKINVNRLRKGTEVNYDLAAKLIKKVNPELNVKKEKLSYEQEEQITRAYSTHFSTIDVAHFLGLTEGRIRCLYNKIKQKKEDTTALRLDGKIVTYRKASEIYHAQDLGFTVEETAKLLGTQQLHVEETLDCREILQPHLVQGLQTIFLDESITKPYLE